MNVEPIEILEYEKHIGGRRVTCVIELFEDGGATVFGDEIDTWIFEFTDTGRNCAIKQVESEGYILSSPGTTG